MPDHLNKISRFWQELKRRKVIRVITVYAASAFVILELADILAPSLGLPQWTLNFVLVLLCVGFVVTVILSWIFDITPEGVRKTASRETEGAHLSASAATKGRRITSNLIMLALFVAVCILLYPKIFRTDKFREIRDKDGRISVAVLPFENLTGDSLLDFWQNGISEYLINGLGNSEELAVISSRAISEVLEAQREISGAAMSPFLARETAGKINASTFIAGNVIGSGSHFSIMVNLENTESGELLWSSKVEGDLKGDYRPLLEALNNTIKNFLEIKSLEERVERELMEAYPGSAEAYRHYIDGVNSIMELDNQSAIESLLKAVELDSSFTLAAFYLAWAYMYTDLEKTYYWTRRAYDLKDQIPSIYHPWLDLWYACFISEDGNAMRRSCNQLEKSGLTSRLALFDLGVTYTDFFGRYEKGIEIYEKIEELNRKWGSEWKYGQYYRDYAWALVMARRPDEVERIVQLGLKVNPDDPFLDVMRGARSVLLGDSIATEKHKENFRSAVRKNNWHVAWAEYWISQMFCWGRDSIAAAAYFRRSYELDSERLDGLSMLIRILLKFDIDVEEGFALSELGLSKDPESMIFRYHKGVALHKMGRHEEALVLLKEADEKKIGYNRVFEQYIKEVEAVVAAQDS